MRKKVVAAFKVYLVFEAEVELQETNENVKDALWDHAWAWFHKQEIPNLPKGVRFITDWTSAGVAPDPGDTIELNIEFEEV